MAVGVLVGAVALVGLAALVARPASTEPISDASGRPVPGSIAELTTVEVDGREHGLMIRGRSRDNPVLLFLAGGPGGSERGAMRRHLPELEATFTVAMWDQRGTGTSYRTLDLFDTLTLDSYVTNTIARTHTSFEVPMFFVQGAHEAAGRAELFEDWYPMIDARIVDVVVLGTSGHRPMFEQPDEFVAYMSDTVLAHTSGP
jgi:pimeloyl-ACP methyl ester carboxylesterase